VKKTMDFHGLKIASVNKEICNKCIKCYEHCRFDAIDKDINIIKESCEGCKVCEYVCPVDAIKMINRNSGFSYISETRFGPMAHAMLKTAEEASGKLVTVVRNNAKALADEKKKDLIIIDGPPGIGCPVIASITGVNLVLIVTEPTLSGIHDLKRIYDVAYHFKIPAVVCINKFDVNLDNSKNIEDYCESNNLPVVGKLPYDLIMTKAMVEEKSIVEFSNESSLCNEIVDMWEIIRERLDV
jgi:MinD superfamily P-loop ATPase